MAVRELNWRRLRSSTLVHNVVSLYGMQLAGYIAPLATLPYLARVLGPSHWGLVAFAQSFGLYTAMVVEGGFALSGAREVARHRNDVRRLGEIFVGVAGAKAILSILCILAATAIVVCVPQFRGNRLMMYSGALAGIAQACNVGWFYQGLERMRVVSAIDISSKALFAISIFLLIRAPRDSWAVLCIQCFWYCTSTLYLTAKVYREFPLCRPTIRGAERALAASASMFLYRGSLALYTTANTLILGFLSTPVSVAYYAAAEKINNVLAFTILPVTQAVYPRMSHLVTHDPGAAAKLARTTLLGGGLMGCVLCGASAVCAPLGVRLVLGPGYEAVVPVLRILSLALPMVTCSVVMGCHYMLPLGMDKEFTAVTIAAGIFNVTVTFLLVPRFAYVGTAWSVVMTETLVALSQFVLLVWRVPHFLSGNIVVLVNALPVNGEAI